MTGFPVINKSFIMERLWVLEQHKKVIAITTVTVIVIALSVFLYIYRPQFTASYKLTGEGESSGFLINIIASPDSTITMFKNTAAETADARAGEFKAEKTVLAKADKNGHASFKLLLNELKLGVNTIHFSDRVFTGLSSNFYLTINKPKISPTLKVSISSSIIKGEPVKKISVVTNPLNLVTIGDYYKNFNSKTGQDTFIIRNYSLIANSNIAPDQMPDNLRVPLTIKVRDIDGQENTQNLTLDTSTLTYLKLPEKIADTGAAAITLKGEAPVGAIVKTMGNQTIADDNGRFSLPVPLDQYGPNVIMVNALLAGEKPSFQTLVVNKLMPKVDLQVTKQTLGQNDFTIAGTATEGAVVTVNGQEAEVSGKDFTWTTLLPFNTSKDMVYLVKAVMPEHRTGEIQITLPRGPVLRKVTEQ